MLKHWRYRLEKGRPHLLLLIGLLLLIVGISVIGGILVFVTGAGGGLGESIWWTFLHITDPGYLGDDGTFATGTFGTVFTVLGMITFMAGLVGILTSLITSGLKHLHEGGAPIAFSEHIVIVGWNSRIFSLIRDLLHASTDMQIAILAPLAKEEAEKQLERRVFHPIERRDSRGAARRARGNVVYRQGSAAVEHDLNRVSAGEAARFILLAEQNGESERALDVAQIRMLYSIERAHASEDANRQRFTTVVEFTSEQFRSHAFYAMGVDPRLDAWVAYYEEQLRKRGRRSFLPVPRELTSLNDMTAVNPDQIVSRVLVQCALQPFMSGVYDEIFSIDGREMFLWRPGSQWQGPWKEMLALPAADRPAFIGSLMQEGVIVGAHKDGHFTFDPALWSPLDDGTHYLVLGDRQTFRERPMARSTRVDYAGSCNVEMPQRARDGRILVLGSNRRFPLVLEQLSDYVEQYPDSHLVIDVLENDELPEQSPFSDNIELNRHCCDFTNWDVLGSLLEDNPPYDSIILLAEDLDIDHPEVDARVTLVLVMLRAYRDDASWHKRLAHTGLVAEVRDPRNRSILRQAQLAGDVIVGDEYVSGFVAQVCLDHRLEELYREVLDYGHHEIYARQLSAVDAGSRFGDLVQAAARRGEIAIGVLKETGTSTRTPLLAPDFETAVAPGDMALVIAGN